MESAGLGEQYPSTSNYRRHKSAFFFFFWPVKDSLWFLPAGPHGGVKPPAASAQPQLQPQEPPRDPRHGDRTIRRYGFIRGIPKPEKTKYNWENTTLKGLKCHRASLCKDQVHQASPYHENAFKSKGGINNLARESPSLGHIQLQNTAPLPSHPPKQLSGGSAPSGPGCCITPMRVQPGISAPWLFYSDAVGHKPGGFSPSATGETYV